MIKVPSNWTRVTDNKRIEHDFVFAAIFDVVYRDEQVVHVHIEG